MTERDESRAAPPATLTDAELQALAYFAVGVGSEGGDSGRDASHRLSFAGNIRNGVMSPVGNSGYSIGTLQTDLGQHPEVAITLIDAYQAWARSADPDWLLTNAEQTQTVDDLGRNGRTIVSQHGRPLDATIKSHLDSFLASDAGITYVHDRDVAQVNFLMRPGGAADQLRGTTLYQNATLDDQAKLATVILKLENQGGNRYYPRIINEINGGTINSAEDARATVNEFLANRGGRSRNEPDYVETGVGHALEATEVFNGLRNANPLSPLRRPWQDVLANPLVNPTQTSQDADRENLSPEYMAVKNLFLQKVKAPALIEAIDQGGAYGYNITNSSGQSRPQSTSLYAAGDDFAVMDGNGIGKAYVGGVWSDVDRANLMRVSNRDGTVDLNINHDGVVERLLHVDPNAPVLRPVQQPAEPAQAASAELQGLGTFMPSRVEPMVEHGMDDNGLQRVIDVDLAPSIAMAPTIPAPAVSPTKSPDDESEDRELESQASARGPFNDPYLARACAAMQVGDSDEFDRIALEFEKSPEGQRMAHLGDQLFAQQQLLEQQQSQGQQMAQARREPLIRL